MATYTIKVNLDNAAFQDGNEGRQLADILFSLARACQDDGRAQERTLIDNNGNAVGTAKRQ